VTGLPNRSAEMDRVLHHLASLVEGSEVFEDEMAAFFKTYGHRSLYLDIYHPPLSAQRELVREWVERIRQGGQRAPVQDTVSSREQMERMRRVVRRGWAGPLKWWTLRHVLGLTRHYMPLREDQRYAWQKALALQRELFLAIGERMARSDALAEPGQVFFLTKPEVNAWVQSGDHQEFARTAASREREFHRLMLEHAALPDRAYPAFLKGNQPLWKPVAGAANSWQGHGVSPGLGRGRVIILHSAEELGRIEAGNVLVASGVDSAWTPVFGLLNGLVLEHGGQLSHAAVIAREYGLPTVAGIEGITLALKDGDQVLIDGLLGVVEKEETDPA
jgi:pyruvate,water dikinase